MHPIAILFGAASFGSAAFSFREDAAAHGMAWLMVIVWAGANVLWLHHDMHLLALLDLPVAMFAYALLMIQPSGWRFVVATAFAFRMTLHIPGAWGMMPVETYLHSINAAFLAALVAISWEGGRRAFNDTVDRVRRVRGFRRRMAAARVVAAEAA